MLHFTLLREQEINPSGQYKSDHLHMSFLTFRYNSSIFTLNSAFKLEMCFWYLNTFSRNWSRSSSNTLCSLFNF